MPKPAESRVRRRRDRRTWGVLAAAALLLVAGCATRRLPAVPLAETTRAEPAVAHARFWAAHDPAPMTQAALDSIRREREWRARNGQTGPLPPAAMLAISGGGDDGAFGAGLLNGWTERGDRPEFKVVTGISTGALIAPFAFLGPSYDPVLKATYTEVTERNIFVKRGPLAALFSDAVADSSPMAALVRTYVTRDLLDRIGAEYAKGRLLLVGTTDLDAREPVIWNMTAIAASRDPKALELFRRVMLASASIPAAFPPVMIDVTADGKRYQEMHVDGGTSAQVFIYPPTLHLGELTREAGAERRRTLYIIRNARLDPDWASVDRRTLTIAQRSVTSLIHSQGNGDLSRIYLITQRDGVDYNLAFIPREFTVPHRTQFDRSYMRALFEYGRRMGAAGYPWQKHPPGYGPWTPPGEIEPAPR
jgi:hypothetical protein